MGLGHQITLMSHDSKCFGGSRRAGLCRPIPPLFSLLSDSEMLRSPPLAAVFQSPGCRAVPDKDGAPTWGQGDRGWGHKSEKVLMRTGVGRGGLCLNLDTKGLPREGPVWGS